MTATLISVGNVLVDLVLRGQLPERGSDSVVKGDGMTAGGAFNAMVAATRQGLPASYAGGHGTGPFGDIARRAMDKASIEILLEQSDEIDSGYDIAIVEDDGERSFLTVFGAEARLTSSQLATVRPDPTDLVLISGYGLLGRTNGAVLPGWIASLAPAVTVLVDPGPLIADIDDETWSTVIERADWLSCNHREAFLLTGERDAEAAARILARTSPGVLVRLGANGCLLAYAGNLERVPGFAVTAVDTNGAGDAHAGAFLAALAEGVDPPEAVLRANACAAIAVTRRGPATAPTRAEVMELIATAR
jgi:sugar/nucleoside kinase (ribokinase family)